MTEEKESKMSIGKFLLTIILTTLYVSSLWGFMVMNYLNYLVRFLQLPIIVIPLVIISFFGTILLLVSIVFFILSTWDTKIE